MEIKPNMIIYFDNGTELVHFGVSGMKWGVRNEKKQKIKADYKSEVKKIKAERKQYGGLIDSIKKKGLSKGITDNSLNNIELQNRLTKAWSNMKIKKIKAGSLPKGLKTWLLKNNAYNLNRTLPVSTMSTIGLLVGGPFGSAVGAEAGARRYDQINAKRRKYIK